MLPKINRLRKKKEINRVFGEGKQFKKRNILMKAAENQQDNIRFCFIVSRKVSNKAVERNKVKRRMRESVRRVLPYLKTGYDVILIALPNLKNKVFKEIVEELDWLFKKAGLTQETL